MKKVYLVSHGTYSGYTVEAVFSNKTKAENYIKGYSYYNEIEEFTVNPPYTALQYKAHYIQIKKDGTCIGIHDNTNRYMGHELYCMKTTMGDIPEGEVKLIVSCDAKDKEDAYRIANTIRMKLIENGEWEKKEKKYKGE